MPTNPRNSSTFVTCIVFLLSLWPAVPATAQGVLKVDTLFRSYAPNVVRYEVIGVHDDTVIIRGRYVEKLPNGVKTYMVHVSTDAGQSFDSLQSLDGSGNHSPLRGLRRAVQLPGWTTPVTYVALDGVNFSEQLVKNYLDVEYAHGYFLHPTHPDTSFLLVRSDKDRWGNYREWMFYRFNDNDQWTNLYVPFPKVGLHRAITLEFDYARPNRLYANVNAETSYGGLADHLGPEWLYYVTDDWGQTWTELEQHPLGADACNGNTSCFLRIGLPMKDHSIVHIPMGPSNISVPVVKNIVTGAVDSTMGASLLRLVDFFHPTGHDSVSNVHFYFYQFLNLECPDVRGVRFRYDTLRNGQRLGRSIGLITTDAGKTWMHQLDSSAELRDRVNIPLGIGSRYSCRSHYLYSTINRSRDLADGRSEIYETAVLRISLNPSATSAEVETQTSLDWINVNVHPNPTTSYATVSLENAHSVGQSSARVVDALGQVCSDKVVVTPVSDTSFSLDVRRLSVGVYRILMSIDGKVVSLPLVVQR